MGHGLGSQWAGVSVYTGSGRQGRVYWPLSAPRSFSPHSQARRRCGQTSKDRQAPPEGQPSSTQRMRGAPSRLPAAGCSPPARRTEGHLRGPRAWILFGFRLPALPAS